MSLFFVDATRRGAAAPADAQVTVVANGIPATTVALPALATMGPGEVTGVDPAQVVRRFPRPGEAAVEPNVVAAIEFDDPALPWLFSPAGTALPWLMLVVLPDRADLIDLHPDGRLPEIHVRDLGSDPEQAGRWAHVQVEVGPESTPESALTDLTAGFARSRLVAPVALQPETDYVAALIPVFEAGRQAGLLDRAVETSPGDVATWVAEQPVPVYDSWRFRTGPSGDFESMARRLQWYGEAPAGTGRRRVAVDPVAARLQPPGEPPLAPPEVRDVPTAIGVGSAAAPPTGADPLGDRIQQVIDGADDDTVVRPPLYGAAPAGISRIPDDPPWLGELNRDPGARSAAGAGARMVQQDQEALVEEAWRQLDAVQRVNERVRWSQVGHLVADRLHQRLKDLPDRLVARVAAPSLDRLRLSDQVVRTVANDGLGIYRSGFAAPARAAARRVVDEEAGLDAFATATTMLEALAAPAVVERPPVVGGEEILLAGTVVPSGEIAGPLLAALDPGPSYERMLRWAHQVEGGGEPLRELHAGPVFTTPAIERLRDLDPEWVLGHAASLPANSVCRLDANGRFVEAFLAGANHELARELRWRGYPVDAAATAFRRFWPHPDPAVNDVPPIEYWAGPLGSHASGGEELQVFVVKGDLLRRYPETIVTAEHRPPGGGGARRPERFRGFLEPDLTYVALSLSDDEIENGGWFLSLRQPLDAPRFGHDVDDERPISTVAGTGGGAAVAHTLYLKPFHVLVPLS